MEPKNIRESILNITSLFGEINPDIPYLCRRGQSGLQRAVFAFFPSVRRESMKKNVKSSIFRKKTSKFLSSLPFKMQNIDNQWEYDDATGIVGCKRLSSPACEGIVLSGRMDSAARGFRSLAGGSGPCGNSRFGTVLRKSWAVGQAQSLLIVRSGRSMPKRNVSREELLYLACRFGRPEKVLGFGCK